MDILDYTRVTSVCGAFIDWSAIPEHILIAKTEIGSLVHRCIELFLSGEELGVIPEEAEGYVISFISFWEAHKHAWDCSTMKIEERLYCNTHMITGQPDLIVQGGGRVHILDWKCSASFHKHYPLQMAAYRYLAETSGLGRVEPPMMVKLSPDGKKPTLKRKVDDREDMEMFFKCLDVYRYFDLGKNNAKKEKINENKLINQRDSDCAI